MLNVIGSDKNKSNVGAGDMRNKQKSNAKKLFQYIIMSRWIMILVDMGPKFQIKVQKCGFVWKWLVGRSTSNKGGVM